MAVPDPLAAAWHRTIILAAVAKLGRELTEPERRFITSRGGYIALEMIEDTVRAEPAVGVERYLNSEQSDDRI